MSSAAVVIVALRDNIMYCKLLVICFFAFNFFFLTICLL